MSSDGQLPALSLRCTTIGQSECSLSLFSITATLLSTLLHAPLALTHGHTYTYGICSTCRNACTCIYTRVRASSKIADSFFVACVSTKQSNCRSLAGDIGSLRKPVDRRNRPAVDPHGKSLSRLRLALSNELALTDRIENNSLSRPA